MELADDRRWDTEGWGHDTMGSTAPGTKMKYGIEYVYHYWPTYSMAPLCQITRELRDRRVALQVYYQKGFYRPQELLTRKEVEGNPQNGCCTKCSHIFTSMRQENTNGQD